MNEQTGLEFLLSLLHQDPIVRPTTTQALMHPWFALLLEERDVVASSYPPAPFQAPLMMVAPAAAPEHVHVPVANAEETEEDTDDSVDAQDETTGDSHAGSSTAEQSEGDAHAMDEENDDDYVDEPASPTEDKRGKKRRKVGLRRAIYKHHSRHNFTMVKVLRIRRLRRAAKRLGTKDSESGSRDLDWVAGLLEAYYEGMPR